MEYVNDFLQVYKKAAGDTLNTIKRVPLIVLMPLVYSFILFGVINVIFNIPLFGRFLSLFISIGAAMLLSAYFAQLEDAINFRRFNLANTFSGFRDYFFSIYFVSFIFYIGSLLGGSLLANPMVSLVTFVVFNGVGESIYIRKTSGLESFMYSIDYLKENWYLWLVHVLVYLLVSRSIFLISLADPLDMYILPIGISINAIIYLLFMGFYSVFRGHLFKETRNSSLRKRKYMGINW